MDTQFEIFIIAIFSVILLIIIFWLIYTQIRIKRFFIGKSAKNLEDTLVNLEKSINELVSDKEKTEKDIAQINKKLRKSIQGMGVIRFNPFPDQGSNQSFAISLLNEDSDGVVISSLYSRERMSVFAKPIKSGQSEYELTEEENTALGKSKDSLS